MIYASVEMAAFQKAMGQYLALTSKTPDQAVRHQARNVAIRLGRELRGIAPEKGSLRAEGERLLAAGRGVKVRPAARRFAEARGTGQRGAVRRELSMRESARGFLAVSARYPQAAAFAAGGASTIRTKSRYGPPLSTMRALKTPQPAAAHATIAWDAISPLGRKAAAGMSKRKAAGAISRALTSATADMRVYIQRKLSQNAHQAFRV